MGLFDRQERLFSMYHVEVGCGDPGVVHAEGAEGDLWGDAQTGLCRPTACVGLPYE
jgi:hypothetical protein